MKVPITSFRVRRLAGRLLCLRFSAHLERLFEHSLALFNTPLAVTREEVTDILLHTLRKNNSADLRVRLTGTWDALPRIEFEPVAPFSPEIERISLYPFGATRSPARLKYRPCRISEESFARARENGFSEGILVSSDGSVSETSWGNVILISWEAGVPRLHISACPSLQGVTQEIIQEIFVALFPSGSVARTTFTLHEVSAPGSGVLVTSSVRGPCLVGTIGSEAVNDTERSVKLLTQIISRYRSEEFWLDFGETIG